MNSLRIPQEGETMEHIGKMVDAYLVEHIGTDSPLYRRLNSDQREAIKSVYKLCDAYTRLLSGDDKVSALSVSLAPAAPAPVSAPAGGQNPLVYLALPVILSVVGALAGGFLLPQFHAAAGICGACLGCIGIGVSWKLRCHVTEPPELATPPAAESEPAKDADSAPEQLTRAVEELMTLVGRLSRPKEIGYDIQRDTHFAAWVQKVMSAVWSGDDRYLKVLVTDELDTRLSEMGLFVCTEPEMEEGKLIAPYDRLFAQKRKEVDEPEVVLPAICLDESPVARGEIWMPK